MLAYIRKEKELAAFKKITNIYFRKRCSDPVAVTAVRQECVVLDTVFVYFFSSFFFLLRESEVPKDLEPLVYNTEWLYNVG